jgi:hypothetical protein
MIGTQPPIFINHSPSRIKIKCQIHLIPGPNVVRNEGMFDLRPVSIIGTSHNDYVDRAFHREGIRLANYDGVGGDD